MREAIQQDAQLANAGTMYIQHRQFQRRGPSLVNSRYPIVELDCGRYKLKVQIKDDKDY
jgi:hypothetical protein